MNADINLQVWLETDASTRPAMVTPYVQSEESKRIDYQLSAVKTGPSGTSNVQQSGTVAVPAHKPTALSQMSISAQQGDNCEINLSLAENGVAVGTYRFDCPK